MSRSTVKELPAARVRTFVLAWAMSARCAARSPGPACGWSPTSSSRWSRTPRAGCPPSTRDPAEYFTDSQRAALTDVGLDLAPRGPSERDPRARTVALQAVLRDTALTVAGAAERIGVDASRIRHRLADGRLAGWKDHGGWRLPVWQFTDDDVLPGPGRPCSPRCRRTSRRWSWPAFMTTPQQDLRTADEPTTPRDWLLAGGDPAAWPGSWPCWAPRLTDRHAAADPLTQRTGPV